MYIRNNSIPGVNSYIVKANYLYITDKHNVFEYYSNKKLFKSVVHLQYFKKHNDIVFINDNYGKGYVISELLYSFLNEPIIYFIDNIYIIYIRKNETKITVFKDTINQNIIGEIPENSTVFYVESNKYIRKNFENNLVEVFLFPKGVSLWSYNLEKRYNWFQRADYVNEPTEEKVAEVTKILGVYNDELWLVLNSGAILSLNIETGKESRFINEGKMMLGESDFENFKGYFGTDTVLDKKKGLIFNLNRHFYIEYNLKSNQIQFESYSFKELFLTHQLNLNYIGGFDEENIYAYEGSDNNCFAIFCRLQKKIIWYGEIEEVKGKFPAIRDMQFDAGKIYLLDHYCTLHIFEKEKIVNLKESSE